MRFKLPKAVCILDIETQRTSFKTPENSKLACVGIMVYRLHNGRYYAGKYKCFMPDQIKELETFLVRVPGIIVGHNVFDFDYRVLRRLMSLKKIVPKTVDTLAILWKRNSESVKGLSLGDLSLVNFGKAKTMEGKSIGRLWREGKYEAVIQYNKNDLLLTRRLWSHIVSGQPILVNRSETREWHFFTAQNAGEPCLWKPNSNPGFL